jgi:hypothetical protein
MVRNQQAGGLDEEPIPKTRKPAGETPVPQGFWDGLQGEVMTTKDFAIGVLGITAVILFAALVIVQVVAPRTAMAYGENGHSGDYIVTTSQLDDTAELIIIVDAFQQKMNVYGFNVPAAQIELIQQFDLAPLQRMGPARPPGGRR